MEVIDVRQLRDVIKDGDSIAATGFSKSGMPFYLFKGIEDSFLECGHPCDLEFNCVAMGGVNIPGTYHDHFGHRGLLSKIRVSHIALAPGINEQIDNNIIPGYMYPLGVLAQLYRDMGAGKPGVISKVGLHGMNAARLFQVDSYPFPWFSTGCTPPRLYGVVCSKGGGMILFLGGCCSRFAEGKIHPSSPGRLFLPVHLAVGKDVRIIREVCQRVDEALFGKDDRIETNAALEEKTLAYNS